MAIITTAATDKAMLLKSDPTCSDLEIEMFLLIKIIIYRFKVLLKSMTTTTPYLKMGRYDRLDVHQVLL